jgi:CYTH domain-containing protein
MPIEIEKKYLIETCSLPNNLKLKCKYKMLQGYFIYPLEKMIISCENSARIDFEDNTSNLTGLDISNDQYNSLLLLGKDILDLDKYTVRIRKIERNENIKHVMTIKGQEFDNGLSRNELEFDINDKQFNTLWPLVNNNYIEKIRSKYEYNGLELEFDEFCGNHSGLKLLEIEFKNIEQASAFVLPTWIKAIDVTKDKKYKNKFLAEGI